MLMLSAGGKEKQNLVVLSKYLPEVLVLCMMKGLYYESVVS